MHKQTMAGAVAAALMMSAAAYSQPPVRNDDLVAFYRDVRDQACHPTNNAMGMITAYTPLDTPLFNHNRGPAGTADAPCTPLLKPDGYQITLGEFKAASGRIVAKCVPPGTRTTILYSGLLAQGTYSVWLFVVNPSDPPPYLGAGSLGTTRPTENFFTANDAGEGQLEVTTPEEDLSAFGHVGPCFLNSVVEVHLVYHSDGTTHGLLPGPIDTWVVNGRFFLP